MVRKKNIISVRKMRSESHFYSSFTDDGDTCTVYYNCVNSYLKQTSLTRFICQTISFLLTNKEFFV